MIKKKYKKDFDKIGLRREIARHVLSCGCITNKDVQLMAAGGERMSTVDIYLRRMTEEGFLKEVRTSIYGRRYRLFKISNYNDSKETLKQSFGDESTAYYEYQKDYTDKMLTDSNTNNESGRLKLLRAVRRSHTAMLMKNAYIRTMADDFNKAAILNHKVKLDTLGSYFFFLDEIKNSFSDVLNSRAIGVLVTPDMNYMVYNQFQYRTQISDVESRTKELLVNVDDYFREDNVKALPTNAALLISEPKPIIAMLKETEEEKERRIKRVFELPEPTFDKLYYVPNTIDGCEVIKRMSKKKWEEDLIKKIGQMYDQKKKTWLTHHATKGEDTYVFFFCIPELNDFYRFINQAREYLDKLKFEVVCFENQKEFLEEVLDKRIVITVIEDI